MIGRRSKMNLPVDCRVMDVRQLAKVQWDLTDVDVIVTSPPYYAARDYQHSDQIGIELDAADYIATLVSVMSELGRRTADNCLCFVVIADTRVSNFHNARTTSYWSSKNQNQGQFLSGKGVFPPNHLRRNSYGVPLGATLSLPHRFGIGVTTPWSLKAELIWDKGMGRKLGGKAPTRAHETILCFAKRPLREVTGQSIIRVAPQGRHTKHPAPFPIELVETLLAMCPEKRAIMDPFCGSGSTAVAAAKLKLPFYGIDVREDYIRETVKKYHEAY